MTRELPSTSLDAFESLEADREDTWKRRILEALREEPDTIRFLAERFARTDGLDAKAVYHDVERRASRLYALGYLERGVTKPNPSGRDAYVHHVSPAGRVWMNGGEEPKPRKRRRDLELAVLNAAFDVADDQERALDRLRQAVAALRGASRTIGPGALEAREKASRGVHAGMSREVPVAEMHSNHLLAAIDKHRRAGVREHDPRLSVLVMEAARRNLWC